ncbi:MAG: ABC transporter ATP-binding protein/permease [Candidatus Moduliflexus flocculans]|nr:ABC transporter ATP-binding protein/permease [Candidatus Moduliflexus flocculans]
MIAFGWVTNMLQRGAASWKRMLDVMDIVPLVADGPGTAADSPRPPIRGAIEIRGLTFAYDGAPVLRDVSLRVAAGETLAVVGPTGSGKSTLISLLPRLHRTAAAARCSSTGADVRDIPLPALRGAIGFVPQEPFLFSETLGANIAFGARTSAGGAGRGARRPRVARLDTDVAGLPEGLRHAGRRARHHALRAGRSSAPRSRARRGRRPAHPHSRRRPLGGGHLHGGGNPRRACAA